MSEAWLKLRLPAADHEVEPLEDALLDQGALSVSVSARDDTTPRFQTPGEPEPALWANCEIEALFEVSTDPLAVLAALASGGPEEHASCTVKGRAHRPLQTRLR